MQRSYAGLASLHTSRFVSESHMIHLAYLQTLQTCGGSETTQEQLGVLGLMGTFLGGRTSLQRTCNLQRQRATVWGLFASKLWSHGWILSTELSMHFPTITLDVMCDERNCYILVRHQLIKPARIRLVLVYIFLLESLGSC